MALQLALKVGFYGLKRGCPGRGNSASKGMNVASWMQKSYILCLSPLIWGLELHPCELTGDETSTQTPEY